MVESVMRCIEAQANEMFRGGIQAVSYDAERDEVVVKLSDNIAGITDNLVKNMFTSAVKRFVESHFPFLKADVENNSELLFKKAQWV